MSSKLKVWIGLAIALLTAALTYFGSLETGERAEVERPAVEETIDDGTGEANE